MYVLCILFCVVSGNGPEILLTTDSRRFSVLVHSLCSPDSWVVVVIVAVVLGFTTLLTSQVISVAFYSEREKADKFCSEALISA